MCIPIFRIPGRDIAFKCEDESDVIPMIKHYIGEKRNLRNLCLAGLDLTDIDLEGLDLSGTDFFRANLTRANLKSTRLKGTCFSHATMKYADLCYAREIGHAIFHRADMNGAKVYDEAGKKTYTLRNEPMHISGLGVPIVVLDHLLAAGCELKSVAAWIEFCKNEGSVEREDMKKQFFHSEEFVKRFYPLLFELQYNREAFHGDIAEKGAPPNEEVLTIHIKNDFKVMGVGETFTVSDVTCPAGIDSDMNIGDTIDFGETKTFKSVSSARMFFTVKGSISGNEFRAGATSPNSSDNSATGYGSCGLETYDTKDSATFTFHPGAKDQADWSHHDEYTGDSPDYGKDCDPRELVI